MARDERSQLYFAYGSNLDPHQMSDRCPGAPAESAARLDGWRFRIGDRGVATIVAEAGAVVWGGLWRLTIGHLATLDGHEGIGQGRYRREQIRVRTVDGETTTALVYVERYRGDGAPRDGYLERILRGAAWFGLPDRYRAELDGWADGAGAGARGRPV
ncbi:MAG: gamma-glutamylcyclotransferase [Acidimicrobiales bacterium]|nr:gamma-glutamylcyclotransferase [Acidimicrobiales bacterium]